MYRRSKFCWVCINNYIWTGNIVIFFYKLKKKTCMGEINKSVPDINKIYAFENSSYS